jgi:hypothetical protein
MVTILFLSENFGSEADFAPFVMKLVFNSFVSAEVSEQRWLALSASDKPSSNAKCRSRPPPRTYASSVFALFAEGDEPDSLTVSPILHGDCLGR